jgi:sulfur-oxidizing protein SoxX
MPSYYRTDHLRQLPAEYEGKTLLSARQIEQLVAYLASLKD